MRHRDLCRLEKVLAKLNKSYRDNSKIALYNTRKCPLGGDSKVILLVTFVDWVKKKL